MLYLLDTADLEEIKRTFDLYPLKGVTTNPTIIAKENDSFLAILNNIREIIGAEKMLHVQALGTTAEEIVKEAEYLNEKIGGELYVKIPVIPEGIKAIRILTEKGINTTATAIFSQQQALMAATAGADFVAPYINRIGNTNINGIKVVEEIVQLLDLHNLECKVLAASFKNAQQVHEVTLAGARAATINANLIDKLLEHSGTEWSVNQFIDDWESVYGEDKLVLDVE